MERGGRSNQTTEEAENAKRQAQHRNWKTKGLIEASATPTRMGWLYNTLTRYGNVHEFSPAAKEWVKSKVATEDVASRAEDPIVTDPWWEDQIPAIRRSSFHKNTLPSQYQGNGPRAGDLSYSSSNSPMSPNPEASSYRPSLFDVITSPIGLGELSDALDVEGLSSHFDFLSLVAELKKSLSQYPPELEAPDNDSQTAVAIMNAYVSKNGPNNILSDLSQQSINVAAGTIGQRIKPKVGQLMVTFDACVQDMEVMLKPLFEEFKQQDAYLDLCAAMDPSNVKHSQMINIVGDKSNGSGAVSTSADSYSATGIPALATWWNHRAPNWANIHQYQSIKVTLHVARGGFVQRFGNQLYAVFGSGSKILKFDTPKGVGAGEFNITVSLPITNTTQYVWVMLGGAGKCLGLVPLALSDLTTRASDGPFALKIRTENNPGKLDDTLSDKMPISPGQPLSGSPTSPSGCDEVVLSYTLSTESPTDPTSGDVTFVYPDDTFSGSLGDFIRGKVSKKKKRFTDDNFNLDLTYITPTVIAMGFPSEGAEGVYRNPLKQVQQFFLTRHPHSYKIYNLCSERAYEYSKFENRCEHYPFDDHNPPPFSMIKEFCENVRKFLAESPQNVVSIHCKAGKGRTGTMIAAYLIYAAQVTAQEALREFGMLRTSNGAGVTIASQIQFVHYFDHYCSLRRQNRPGPGRTTLFLESIALRNIGSKYANQDITWQIHIPNRYYDTTSNKVLESTKPITLTPPQNVKPRKTEDGNGLVWHLEHKLIELHEDVRFEFNARMGMSKEKLFHSWINTRFVKLTFENGKPVARIYKQNLDKASKDVRHKKLDEWFHLELVFTPVTTAAQQRLDQLTVQGRPELTETQYMITTTGSVQLVNVPTSTISE